MSPFGFVTCDATHLKTYSVPSFENSMTAYFGVPKHAPSSFPVINVGEMVSKVTISL
jgi:hypothetical protein